MAEDLDFEQASTAADYTSDDIKTLDWKEHIRKRPGMYIGKLGDGSHSDDGIYVILKEVIDNSIDEFAMGFGKQIVVNITDDGTVEVRDYGRGIPLESVVDVSSKMNTGAKYDSDAFKKSVGLNGVGMKATNALSTYFEISSCRNGEKKKVCYSRGEITDDCPICPTDEENGTYVKFVPDKDIFLNYKYNDEFVETMMKNYSFLNTGLTIVYNGRRIHSRNGLVDLLRENMTNDPLYPIMHFTGTSTPPRAALTCRHSERLFRAQSRSFTERISNIPTSATAWLLQSASRCRNRCLSRRPRQNSAHAT